MCLNLCIYWELLQIYTGIICLHSFMQTNMNTNAAQLCALCVCVCVFVSVWVCASVTVNFYRQHSAS